MNIDTNKYKLAIIVASEIANFLVEESYMPEDKAQLLFDTMVDALAVLPYDQLKGLLHTEEFEGLDSEGGTEESWEYREDESEL